MTAAVADILRAAGFVPVVPELSRGARPPQHQAAQAVPAVPGVPGEKHKGAVVSSTAFAAEASENANEYVAERTAICAADGLDPSMLRHVFVCTLKGNPPFVLLAKVGASAAETEADLKRQFGDDFVSLEPHRSPRAAP